MKTKQKNIFVYADWAGLAEPIPFGILYAESSRGKEIFSFEYNDVWLKMKLQGLDPALQLFSGKHYPANDQKNFGIFLDSSPDRWGRFLMDRREAYYARHEKRKENKLLESDYLLGVYDEHRMGALRFSLKPEGPFLDNNKKFSSPPFSSLRELEQASLAIEKNSSEKDPHFSRWLNMLIVPGSSLGGARPKASVVDTQGCLWIAKFPSYHDEYDIGAWEMLVNSLAGRAKITVANAQLKKFNTRHHIFLTKRFDRTDKRKRIHFASAMTLLQRQDGEDGSSGVSYLELAEFIMLNGREPDRDLEQLWRRIVFFMCVSNVDDHLRNHGFIFHPKGWELSPAYDMNPVAMGEGLKLNISESDNSQDFLLALEVAKHFRIHPKQANQILQETIKVVKTWRAHAKKLGISASEQDRMARAFRLVENS